MRPLPFALLFAPAFLLAQENVPLTIALKKYDVADGLLHRRVTSITQDRGGFLWIATPVGIQRFDGYTFTSYTRAEGLHGDGPNLLVQDSDGLIWIFHSLSERSQVSGVDILDPRQGGVKTFQQHFGDRAALRPEDLLLYARVLADSTLLLAANDRLVSYHGRTGFRVVPLKKAAQFLPLSRAADGSVLGIEGSVHDGSNTLMRMRADGSALDTLLARRVDYVTSLGTGGEWDPARAGGMLKDGNYLAVHTEDGRVGEGWSSPEGRLRVFEGERQEDRAHERHRLRVGEDLWLVGSTLRRMRAGDDPLEAPIVHDLADRFPEIALRIRNALIDRAGHVWLGTEFGLYRLDIRPSSFQRMLWQANIPKGFGTRIRGMAVVGDRLHVNTEVEGYWVVDARDGSVLRHDTTPGNRSGLRADGEGGVFRSLGNQVIHDRADGISVQLCSVGALVRSFMPMDRGDVLIGTSNGLYRWSAASRMVLPVSADTPIGEALERSTVFHIERMADGLWVCTTAGLFRLDDQGGPVERWSSESDEAHSIPALDIRHVAQGKDGVVWLASGDAGIIRWHPATNEAKSIGRRDGMPSLSVHAVHVDGAGHIWAPTDDGLVRYAPSEEQLSVFTTADGITHNEFNRLAHAAGPDGRFYCGGLNGITVVDPRARHEHIEGPQPPLLITQVQQFDDASGTTVDHTREVRGGKDITLRPGDRFLSVSMALLSFEEHRNILYAWRIDGIDGDWNHQREPLLRFASLPYGDHVLRIKARGGDGAWATQEITLRIHALRPWYLRWWAILLAVLIIAGIVRAVFRSRLRQARKVYAMRDRIAADLHDEVGSSLSNIAMFSELAARQAVRTDVVPGTLVPRMGKLIERINEHSTVAMENMNDIVWSVNTRHDAFDAALARMQAFAAHAAEARGFQLVFNAEERLAEVKLDMEQRRNIHLVLKEAVNNAAKYSGCMLLEITFIRERDTLCMRVADNGSGFDPAVRNTTGGGHGLLSMRSRADAMGGSFSIDSAVGKGTTIRLQVPLVRRISTILWTRFRPGGASFANGADKS